MLLVACEPSKKLYDHVKAAFVAKGSSLNKQCDILGVEPANARRALFGEWSGEKGQEVKDALIKAAGLSKESK